MASWKTKLLQQKREKMEARKELLVTSWTSFQGEPFVDIYENDIDLERYRNYGTYDGAMSLSMAEAKSIRDALQAHIDRYEKK